MKNKLPNECECGKPTNGKLRCSSCGCWTCDHATVYTTDRFAGNLLVCYAAEFEEQGEGFFLAPVVNSFDNSYCPDYRRKSEK